MRTFDGSRLTGELKHTMGRFSIALDLVKKIRDRYETKDPEVLTAFVDLLRRFQRDLISLEETRSHVSLVSRSHAPAQSHVHSACMCEGACVCVCILSLIHI